MMKKREGLISHGIRKRKRGLSCVVNPSFSISGLQPKMGHGRMSDDYQITAAERVLCKADPRQSSQI